MKIKKIISSVILVCCLFLCTACGCSKKDTKPVVSQAPASEQTISPSASAPVENTTDNNDKKTSVPTPVPESSNKEVVSDDKAPDKIFWLMSGDNNLTYHLENCAQIKDKGAQEVSWEIVKTIGLRQCPECNPPQYEGYVNN